MLAIFDKSVAKSSEALQSPESGSICAFKDGILTGRFAAANSGAVTVKFGASGIVSYSLDKQNPLLPRLFAVVDDIFCLFQGHIENVALLKKQYGLNKAATEVTVVIEAYRLLRDRGPYPADQVVRDLHGKFAFILYDCSTKNVFLARDEDGSVPFFWGADAEANLVLSDDVETVKKGCGKSFAPFPKGSRSYEYPLNELKSVPRVDSSGEVWGAMFKVDSEAKKESAMPRIRSVQSWSQQI